ncbi:MAG: DUF2911 domain-containing protein [Cyclobacteriaceae bacterium]
MNKKIMNMNTIAKLSLFLMMLMAATVMQAQDKVSPPASVKAKVNGVDIKISYHQPAKKGRVIWGGIVKYGRIWRTGANEATVFDISADVKIDGQLLRAGKYALFTIPGKNEWTIIFNREYDQFGAFEYNAEKDALRVTAKPAYGNTPVESFTIDIDSNGRIILMWDDVKVGFKVT